MTYVNDPVDFNLTARPINGQNLFPGAMRGLGLVVREAYIYN